MADQVCPCLEAQTCRLWDVVGFNLRSKLSSCRGPKLLLPDLALVKDWRVVQDLLCICPLELDGKKGGDKRFGFSIDVSAVST